jgi:hypothetical protein
MDTSMCEFKSGLARYALGVTALLAFASAHAQTASAVRVTAVNSDNGGAIYDVSFAGTGGSTSALNPGTEPTTPTPGSGSNSLVYGTGSSPDLFATSEGYYPATNPSIRRFAAPGYTSSINLLPEDPYGPRPIAIDLDNANNVYFVTNYDGTSPVYVLPKDPNNAATGYSAAGGVIVALPGSDVNLNPFDPNYAWFQYVSSVADLAVVNSAISGGPGVGDVLALTYSYRYTSVSGGTTPPPLPIVVRYAASDVQGALASNGTAPAPATVLVGDDLLPLAAFETVAAIAISPLDGSLLIATNYSDVSISTNVPVRINYGLIYRVPFIPPVATTSSVQPGHYGVASLYARISLGSTGSLRKIKAAVQGGQLVVYASEVAVPGSANGTGGGGILEFVGAPPVGTAYFTAPTATVAVTTGTPGGIAVSTPPPYRTVTQPASNCIAPLVCDTFGDGTILTTIRGSAAALARIPAGATVTSQLCVVKSDPRGPNCGATSSTLAKTLALKDVCPGLSDTRVIPAYACGNSGTSKTGFVIVAGTAEGVDSAANIEVVTDASSAVQLPAPGSGGVHSSSSTLVSSTTTSGSRRPPSDTNPKCPDFNVTANVAIYSSNDHSAVETQFPEDPVAHELTSSCDPTRKLGPGMSIDGFGFKLVLQGQFAGITPIARFVSFTNDKFANLITTVNNANISLAADRAGLLGCINRAQTILNKGHYACAARKVFRCDKYTKLHEASFGSTPPFYTPRAPNAFADIRGRLGNIYLTIDSRILGNKPAVDWPLPSGTTNLCPSHEDDGPEKGD